MRTIGAEMFRIVLDHERSTLANLHNHGRGPDANRPEETHAAYVEENERAKTMTNWIFEEIKKQYGSKEE